MSEDRTPRTFSLTSNEEGEERPAPHPRRHRQTPSTVAPIDAEVRAPRGEEHLPEVDPRDRSRMTPR